MAANRGTVFLQAWEQEKIAERESFHVVTTCMFCKEWVEGPMGEGRTWYLAHRLEFHPEIKPTSRRRRKRLFGQLNTEKSLDENIAKARAQGASTWAGDLET